MFSRKLFVKNRQNKKIIYLSVAIMAILLLVIILGINAKQNQNTDEEADFSYMKWLDEGSKKKDTIKQDLSLWWPMDAMHEILKS